MLHEISSQLVIYPTRNESLLTAANATSREKFDEPSGECDALVYPGPKEPDRLSDTSSYQDVSLSGAVLLVWLHPRVYKAYLCAKERHVRSTRCHSYKNRIK